MIEVNDILTSMPDRKTAIEGIARVIGISNDGCQCALIQLDVWPIKAPYILPLNSIDPDIQQNGIVRLKTFDAGLPLSEEELSAKKRKRLDSVFNMMSSTMNDKEMIFDPEYRGREFSRISLKHSTNTRTVRRCYYLYLWGGMIKMAFAGPQKMQNAEQKKQRSGTNKRGPKPQKNHAKKDGSLPLYVFRENLEKGARLFFFNGKHTETEAFVLTKKKYYSNGKKASKAAHRVNLDDILLPPENLPSARQFHYVIAELRKTGADRDEKPRMTTPARTRKARRGKARDGVPGPGYRYEIDATKVQIRIVSRFGSGKLIREATLYIIIDVWSGAIVGYALSLDPASWDLAAKALYNCFTPKSKVFKRLGLPYDENDWTSQHLPTNLTADRAELISDKAGVVPEIGINVEIMPPMCPERKGSVEGKLEDVKHGDNFYLKPGKHRKSPKRREKDGKKDAAFTLEELEVTIVEIIMDLNNDPVPIENMPDGAVEAGVSAITYGGLFSWGLKHRPGFTRKLPETVVENELMLKGKGSVTPEGIRFRKQNYTSDALHSSGLMAKAAMKGNFGIDVRYDDLAGYRIRYFDTKLRKWIDVYNDNTDVQRLHASFWEIEEHLSKAEALHAQAKENNISRKDDKAHRLNKQARAAIKRAKDAKSSGSHGSTKQAIKLNTSVELAAERSKRLLAEQQSVAQALAVSANKSISFHEKSQPHSDSSPTQTKSVGQRSLELWRKNAHLGK